MSETDTRFLIAEWIDQVLVLSRTQFAAAPRTLEAYAENAMTYRNRIFWDRIPAPPSAAEFIRRKNLSLESDETVAACYFSEYSSEAQKLDFIRNQKNLLPALDRALLDVRGNFTKVLKQIALDFGLASYAFQTTFPSVMMQYVAAHEDRFKDNPHLSPVILLPAIAKKITAERDSICNVQDLGWALSAHIYEHHKLDMLPASAFLIAKNSMPDAEWQTVQDRLHIHAAAKKPTIAVKLVLPSDIREVSDARAEFLKEAQRPARGLNNVSGGRSGLGRKAPDLWKPR